jgi:hypothetical protein
MGGMLGAEKRYRILRAAAQGLCSAFCAVVNQEANEVR